MLCLELWVLNCQQFRSLAWLAQMLRRWCSLWSAEGADNFLSKSISLESFKKSWNHKWIACLLMDQVFPLEWGRRKEVWNGYRGKEMSRNTSLVLLRFCIHSLVAVHAQDQDFSPHLSQNKPGLTLSVFTGPFLPPNHLIFAFWAFSPAEAILPWLCTAAHWAFSCPGTRSWGSAFQHCWHHSLQTTFFLAVLLIGDYSSKAGLGKASSARLAGALWSWQGRCHSFQLHCPLPPCHWTGTCIGKVV